jgi:hypothetical protein
MTTIRKIPTVLIITIFIAFSSCNLSNKKNDPVWSDLPEVTNLNDLKQTDFVVTLENPISDNRNIIYAPAFLFAWDKIKEELKSPITINDKNSPDFKLLNKSISHQNSLTNTEYTARVEIIDGAIIARAFFNKTIPFETKLQVLDEPIHFGTANVSAFGMDYFDEEAIKFTQILYYKDDNNFILKLIPKDKQHEIILAKGLDKYQTLKDGVKLTNDLITEGIREQVNTNLSWKYYITPDDMFAIPAIKFNIATNYKNLEGQSFLTKDTRNHSLEIAIAYQSTGFILNENGAVVESLAVTAVVDSASASPIITHPKKMVFDKPFLIVIKRADKPNPYFVMKVANAELLKIK